MNGSTLVRGLEAIGNLMSNGLCVDHRQRPALKPVRERGNFDEFEDGGVQAASLFGR